MPRAHHPCSLAGWLHVVCGLSGLADRFLFFLVLRYVGCEFACFCRSRTQSDSGRYGSDVTLVNDTRNALEVASSDPVSCAGAMLVSFAHSDATCLKRHVWPPSQG